ncbi:MAG: hypothetical protein K2O73_01680 [Lachnospiraceae bacterium]|nr:hypothetical protein [Lachnospiraceae bacterium]
MKKISLVIPCYNEQEALPTFYPEVTTVFSGLGLGKKKRLAIADVQILHSFLVDTFIYRCNMTFDQILMKLMDYNLAAYAEIDCGWLTRKMRYGRMRPM